MVPQSFNSSTYWFCNLIPTQIIVGESGTISALICWNYTVSLNLNFPDHYGYYKSQLIYISHKM